MDLQKTMEFILNSQANFDVQMEKMRLHQERGDVQMEDLRASQKKTEATLRRAIRIGVQEARNERAKRRELGDKLDEKLTQLAAAQLLTEEQVKTTQRHLDEFIQSLKRGGNGQPKS